MLAGAFHVPAGEVVFHPPERVTDSDKNHRMTANPTRQMAFDSTGRLHAVWWSGYFGTSPETPAEVLYSSWKPSVGWSAIETVDESFDGANRVGSRQPALAIAADDTVWVVWHDHRHSRPGPPYNWIDNIEIYADSKPPGGSFSANDLRLTTTSATHFGDNGYTPRIAIGSTGTMKVVWYDFHFNGNISDLFLKTVPPGGTFDPAETIGDMRLTNFDDRMGSNPFNTPSYTHPELVEVGNDDWYIIWTEGFGLPAPLWLAPIPASGFMTSGQQVASATDGYFNPASVRATPDGALWIGWTDRSGANRRPALRRRGPATGTLEPVWYLTDGQQRAESLSFEFDSEGMLHAAWVEVESFQQSRIVYRRFNPANRALLAEQTITPEAGAWEKPALVLDNRDVPHILFGEYYGDGIGDTGDIWFTAGVAPPVSASDVWAVF